VSLAIQAGLRLVQLREKQLPHAEYLALAHDLRRLTARHDALLLLNARVELVREVGADGVHLPRAADVASARQRLGPEAVIGYSAHSRTELDRAQRDGADFVTLSPVFPSLSKPGYDAALGLERFGTLAQSASLPVYALGGVTIVNARDCLAAGAAGVAVVGAIMAAPDIGAVIGGLLEALHGSGPIRSQR
jgi:thiamine-phosphate pyrophosphorylase